MMAINLRNPPEGLLHHSDRGSQYAAHAYQALRAGRRAQWSQGQLLGQRRLSASSAASSANG
ncbi:MAG: hypothetical protein R3F36_01540 [Candidatus Competibacteraceae bacterium]